MWATQQLFSSRSQTPSHRKTIYAHELKLLPREKKKQPYDKPYGLKFILLPEPAWLRPQALTFPNIAVFRICFPSLRQEEHSNTGGVRWMWLATAQYCFSPSLECTDLQCARQVLNQRISLQFLFLLSDSLTGDDLGMHKWKCYHKS